MTLEQAIDTLDAYTYPVPVEVGDLRDAIKIVLEELSELRDEIVNIHRGG